MSDKPFELEPYDVPEPRALPGRVVAVGPEDEVAEQLLGDLLISANDAVGEHERFDLAISCSSLLQPLWQRFMLDPDLRGFPWAATHLWLLDSELDQASWLHESLLWPAGIPIEQVHPGRLEEASRETVCAAILVSEPGGDAPLQRAIAACGALGRIYVWKPEVTSLASLELTAEAVLQTCGGPPPPGTLRWYLTLH